MPNLFYKQNLCISSNHIVILREIMLPHGKSLLHVIDIWCHIKLNLQDAMNMNMDTALLFLSIFSAFTVLLLNY